MTIDIESVPDFSAELGTGTTGEDPDWDLAPPPAGPPTGNPWSAGIARRMTRRLVDGLKAGETAAVCAHFAEHAVLTLGNNPPIIGREAINTCVEKLLPTAKDLRPRIVNTWHIGADTVVEVTCDVSPLNSKGPVAGAVIWRLGADGLIQDLRVHIDLSSTSIPPVT